MTTQNSSQLDTQQKLYIYKTLEKLATAAPDLTEIDDQLAGRFAEPLNALLDAVRMDEAAGFGRAWRQIAGTYPGLLRLRKRPWSFYASPLDEIARWPKPRLLNDYLPAESLVMVYGKSGHGKSFYILDLLLTLALEYRVLYVPAEGRSALNKRIDAWCKARNRTRKELDFSVPHADSEINLVDDNLVNAFIEGVRLQAELDPSAGKPVVIVFDTLAGSMLGDENSSHDVGKVLHHCGRLRDKFGATVILVHHTSKSGKDERGHSALRGACDMMIYVEKSKDNLMKVECTKAKDAPEFPTLTFDLCEIKLDDGEVSCYLEPRVPGNSAKASATPSSPSPKTQTPSDRVYAVLVKAGEPGMTAKEVMDATDMSQSAVYRHLKSLRESGSVQENDGRYQATSQRENKQE